MGEWLDLNAGLMLSERFFPPGSPFDAYVAIRDILDTAITLTPLR